MEQENVLSQFIRLFNAEDFKGIYAMLSVNAKSVIAESKFSEFISGMYKNAGKIIGALKSPSLGNEFVYEVKFENYVAKLLFSLNENDSIDKIQFIKIDDQNLSFLVSNERFQLPFKERWNVIWGGDTLELNYHHSVASQKFAFDFFIKDKDGRTNAGINEDNYSYYAFGKEIISPCNGEIVFVVDGIEDNVPGQMNRYYIPGNSIMIKTHSDEYLFLAHLKQNTIKIKKGSQVYPGQPLALCGNSGRSSEPHLHMHLQNGVNLEQSVGIKIIFDCIKVNSVATHDYSPIRSDVIEWCS